MKLFHYMLCFWFIALFISCSTVKVNHEYNSGADFTAYKSYDWLPVPKRNMKNSHITEKIKFVLSRELESKGIKKVSHGADFMIALHGVHHGFIFYEDYVYLSDNYKPYLDRRIQDFTQYRNNLIVDFIDTGTKDIVFRGIADAFITDIAPERLDKSINEAVTGILDNFPPGQFKEER